MAHIVTGNCENCVFTDCVEVCPVSCFYIAAENANMLYINPDECIDCRLCVDQCPVKAIYAEDDVPDDQKQWIQINRDQCASGELVTITEKRDPLPGALEKKAALGL